MPTPASLDKAAARASALSRRALISPDERASAGLRLAEALLPLVREAHRVAAYAAFADEPPTELLLLSRPDVLLPVLLPDNDLDWRIRGSGASLGVEAIAECDLILVPAVAVDAAGVRLGRGGGSYDRALRRTTGRTIALLYDDELVDRLPREEHDRTVDAVATPREGVVRLPVPQ